MKKLALRYFVAALALAAFPAFAVLDTTVATTGISDAQTAVLSVLGAFVVLAAAVYGVKKVLYLLGGGVMTQAESDQYFRDREGF